MLGQTRLEFIFGVIIFALIILYIVSQINNTFSTVINDYNVNNIKAEANDITEILILDKGNPENWDILVEQGPTVVKTVGLANEQNVLSSSKIYELNKNCSLMSNFGIDNYRLKIYNSTNLLLFCGTNSLKPAQVVVSKYVMVENDLGNITLELW
jgi:hypothetical protein